ncbi:uncharacterized protein FPRO_03418 [Fusarium proliferatum ET1]|uniref:Uncharacterized protein n=1 Tax=Fusarium proliferatum (strain ET1) TaxID=1227346 RepID=A0A1L7V7Z1_FUSPR|nr:uncharacterized protein FPRO_03418 [Fusarium proliferatum ET1]CZR36322.1 uncharacterized protein FPRO_03418 [Fusarium proliferatum ET1]
MMAVDVVFECGVMKVSKELRGRHDRRYSMKTLRRGRRIEGCVCM